MTETCATTSAWRVRHSWSLNCLEGSGADIQSGKVLNIPGQVGKEACFQQAAGKVIPEIEKTGISK